MYMFEILRKFGKVIKKKIGKFISPYNILCPETHKNIFISKSRVISYLRHVKPYEIVNGR